MSADGTIRPILMSPEEVAMKFFLAIIGCAALAVSASAQGRGMAAIPERPQQQTFDTSKGPVKITPLYNASMLIEIPGTRVMLVEWISSGDSAEYYVHTPLAHAANDALARVAVWRLGRELGVSATSIVADLGFALLLRRSRPLTAEMLRCLLTLERFQEDLDAALVDSTVLRERM